MPNMDGYQAIIKKLHSAYLVRGYVTEESVLNAIIEHGLALNEVDYICGRLLSMGVLIHDNSIEDTDDEEDVYDRSQTDYEKLFQEVMTIDESLAPFMYELSHIKPPQHREWQNLIPQAKNNNYYAKQRIIEMYLRTVVKIALQNHKKYKLPLAETIQDGCEGLVMALNKYETGKHGVFLTYASMWIMQNIMREAPTLNPLIYIPVHMRDKLFSIYEILDQCYSTYYDSSKLNLETLKAVSEKLGCSQDEAEKYVNYLNTFESIEELLEKDQSCFIDHCVTEERIFIDINKIELENNVTEILRTLTPREEEVVLLRFGFIDEKEWTLEEVGDKMGVTRERIRQIEKKAINRLRHPSRQKLLKYFLG